MALLASADAVVGIGRIVNLGAGAAVGGGARLVMLSAPLLLGATAPACDEGHQSPHATKPSEQVPLGTFSGTASRGASRFRPEDTTIPVGPLAAQFAAPMNGAAVLDRKDARTSAARCRVHRACEPFAALPLCDAGIQAIDASALGTFVPRGLGERVRVRGPLGLALTRSTAGQCKPAMAGVEDCCNQISIAVFVGAAPNGMRLEGLACYGDESRLCCPVPAFGQMVVAEGRIMKETESTVLFHGGRFSLADPVLCTEHLPAGQARTQARP